MSVLYVPQNRIPLSTIVEISALAKTEIDNSNMPHMLLVDGGG